MSFLEKIYKLMEEKGLSKNALCKRLEINTNSFGNWEKRGTLPSADVIVKLASFFGVSSDYLLGLDSVPNIKEMYADLSKNDGKVKLYVEKMYSEGIEITGEEYELVSLYHFAQEKDKKKILNFLRDKLRNLELICMRNEYHSQLTLLTQIHNEAEILLENGYTDEQIKELYSKLERSKGGYSTARNDYYYAFIREILELYSTEKQAIESSYFLSTIVDYTAAYLKKLSVYSPSKNPTLAFFSDDELKIITMFRTLSDINKAKLIEKMNDKNLSTIFSAERSVTDLTEMEIEVLEIFNKLTKKDQLKFIGRMEQQHEEYATPPMAFAARSAGPENTNCRPQIDPEKLDALDDIPTMDEE